VKVCKACGKEFWTHSGNARFCREAPCPSFLFGKKTKLVSHQPKLDSITKKEACKIIICMKIDEIRDEILKDFSFITKEEFECMKKKMIKGHCGQAIHAKSIAAAIFFNAVIEKFGTSSITKESIIKFVGCDRHAVRKYSKWYDQVSTTFMKELKDAT